MDENLHKGHRERVKKRFLEEGTLDKFSEHEVLEMLLFYCYPRGDVNEIAHRLIREFGTLHNLFETEPLDIQRRSKVSNNVAVLISMMPHLSRKYLQSKWDEKIVIDNQVIAGEYCSSLFIGRTVEYFFIVCLDNQNKLIYSEISSEGTINQTAMYIRSIVEIALKHRAIKLILTHNHPSGTLKPSKSDIASTAKIIQTMELIGIEVLDHIIVGGGKYFSFCDNGVLPLGY